MNRARALQPTELTPEARLDRAKRLLVEAVDELVSARLAQGLAASEWVDQKTSPLGASRHRRLCRTGKIPAVREGHRWLARRADVNAYLEANGKRPVPMESDDDVDAMIQRIAGVRT